MYKDRFEWTVVVCLVLSVLLLGYMAFGMHSILGSIPKQITTENILEKLYTHDEFKSYANTNPLALTQITTNNLEQLMQQIPGLDERYIGALAIGFEDRIVLFDYDSDTVLANIPISNQPAQNVPPQQPPVKKTANSTSVK